MKYRAKINGEWTDWVDKETLRQMKISAFTRIQGEGSQEINTAGNTPGLADFWQPKPTIASPKPKRKRKWWVIGLLLSFFLVLFIWMLWQSARSGQPITREDKLEFYQRTLEQANLSYYEENFQETKSAIALATSLEQDLELNRAVDLTMLRENAINQGDDLLAMDVPDRALSYYEIAQAIENNREIRRKIRQAKARIPN